MSLQIWLPFSYPNDSKNYGLLDGDLTWTTAPSISQDGKMHGCISSGGCKMSAEQTAQVLNNNEFSFCCWMYPIAETGTAVIEKDGQDLLFGNNANTIAGNNRKYSLFIYPTVNDLHWSWMNDDPGENATGSSFKRWAGGTIPGVFPSGEWTHVAVTYKNPNGAIYINGNKVRTFTGVSNSSTFAYEKSVIRNDENNIRKLCDYRVYSNCLSAKEVKEISKCLVVHNKLSAPGADNLIQNSYDCANWTIADGFIKSIDEDDGSTVLSFSRTGSTANQWYRAYSNQIAKDDVINDGMTISFDFKCESVDDLTYTCICALQTFNSSGTRLYFYEPQLLLDIQDNRWVHVSLYISSSRLSTVKSGYSSSDISYYIVSWQLVRDGYVYFKKMKVEIGNKSTPWIPNRNDSLFNDLGFNEEYIDNTGCGYSSAVVGCPLITTTTLFSNDTPKYNACYKFITPISSPPGPSGVMNGPSIYASGYNYEWTISLWTKFDAIPSSEITLFSVGNVKISINSSGDIVITDINDNISVAPTSLSDTKWHLYTICCTKNTTMSFTFYFDLEEFEVNLESISGDDKRLPLLKSGSSSYDVSIPYLVGKSISDFRIYSTILDKSDIEELYYGSISIDKSGNIMAAEFEEV